MNFLSKLLRKEGKPWLRAKHIAPYLRLTIWSLGLEEFKSHYELLSMRIHKLYLSQSMRKNLRQVFTYLKEAFTVLYHRNSQTKYVPKVRIKTDSEGYPKIIPVQLRKLLSDRKHFIGVGTLLGIHRVIGWWPKVDYSTITAPFNGLTQSIDISILRKAKRNLCILAGSSRLRLPRVRGLIIETSGPNGPQSVSRIVVDALAFIHHPKTLWSLIRFYLLQKSYIYPLILIVLILLGTIPYLLSKDRYYLGRLGVVRNVAGKARVVAMTNWWIQVALKPLHSSIFEFLKSLDTDGTFDQTKPLYRLAQMSVQGFCSYDLSAATDRLPIQLQEQVLALFTSKRFASLWRDLMSIPFVTPEKELIRYSVGQPMGAYSSWAMLALTHHMIVQCCSPIPTQEYAILGDDVCVSNALSKAYLDIMEKLGVSISLHKSYISNEYIEFAKKLIRSDLSDYSILGPGLIMSAVKNRFLSALLVLESHRRSFINIPEAIQRLSSKKGSSPLFFDFGLYTLFGVRGQIRPDQKVADESGMIWLRDPNYRVSPTTLTYALYNSLCTLLLKRYRKSRVLAQQLQDSLPALVIRWCKQNHGDTLGILWIPLYVLSPGVWLYYNSTLVTLDQPFPKYNSGGGNWDDIQFLADQIREIKIENLDSYRRADVNAFVKGYKELISEMNLTLNDLSEFHSNDSSHFY